MFVTGLGIKGSMALELAPDATTSDVLSAIGKRQGDPNFIKHKALFFAGKQLSPNTQLSDEGVGAEATLELRSTKQYPKGSDISKGLLYYEDEKPEKTPVTLTIYSKTGDIVGGPIKVTWERTISPDPRSNVKLPVWQFSTHPGHSDGTLYFIHSDGKEIGTLNQTDDYGYGKEQYVHFRKAIKHK